LEGERFGTASGGGTVRGENSQYVFELFRRAETKPWVIVKVEKFEQPRDAVHHRVGVESLVLFTPGGPIGLPDVLQSKEFKPIDISQERPGSKPEELVRVTFRYSPDNKKVYPRDGVVAVALDPLGDWVLRRAEVEIESHGKKRKGIWKSVLRRDYKPGPDGHPLLSGGELRNTFQENGQVIDENRYLVEMDLKQRKSIPESEFTLSAYGLPEPYWARPEPRPWYLWFGIAGIVCLALGASAFWLKRRRAAAAP
jgi:hypothetical protein